MLLICIVAYVLFRLYGFYKKDERVNDHQKVEFNRNADHLVLTKHAKCRMDCRHISEQEIKEILHTGKINYNKSDLNDKRGPKYAVEGFSNDRQHIRVVFAPEGSVMKVITCIDLDEEWKCPTCD